MTNHYDVAIVGAGPSGLTAGIHAAFEGLSTVVISPYNEVGGQASQTSLIENYPGFPHGATGQSLMLSFRKQALRLGVHLMDDRALDLDRHTVLTEHGIVDATHIIIACGLSFKPLSMTGEQTFRNHGLWYGPNVHHLERSKDVAIIGGANSAGQAALFHAKHSHTVHLVTRHPSLLDTMSDKLARDIVNTPNIMVEYMQDPTSVSGHESLQGLCLTNVATGDITNLDVTAVFVCIGQEPHTAWLHDSGIALDEKGHILAPNLETSLPGVYAIGDVRVGAIHRIILAASDGARVIANILEKGANHV